ncbi:hypothetical protein H072_3103 [Dactylellina haptotyla CBS 200.50]|uniref:FAD-binding PCMH-type domain-containing protein n=1 Tax=Dactylellina haptotyla (strain CBS 200.50) TaxID=1284197 RepID=S8AP32_DACHA|nr:hypothetical protein H072_3103 [Dactylellina haptotyla CBS 200.50]
MADFNTLSTELKAQLSAETKIMGKDGTILRWDESCAPSPIMTVTPGSEADVAEIVKYCRNKGLKCFAQSGGHSWRVKHYREIDVVINLRGLNSVTVDTKAQTATMGGGTLVGELIDAVSEKKLEAATGVCNSVGALGSLLNGGVGRYMGKYGLGIDNLLSINCVDASGTLHRNVTKETDEDLWWAILGAGASLGIVTQATIKVYPESNGGMSWTGVLLYGDSSKVETVVQTISEMEMDENMCVHFLFACPPPTLAPVVMVVPWYYGPEDEAEKVWKPLLDIGPTFKQTGMAPANKLNEGNDAFGEKGGRKPGVGLGLEKIDPVAYKQIWNMYVNFIKENPDAGRSIVLAECYPKAKMESISRESTAFANRDMNYMVICVPWYEDEKLDIRANSFSQSVREIWAQKCGHPDRIRCYTAFAGINEPIGSLFGEQERIEKLRYIKKQWDPENYWGALMDVPA